MKEQRYLSTPREQEPQAHRCIRRRQSLRAMLCLVAVLSLVWGVGCAKSASLSAPGYHVRHSNAYAKSRSHSRSKPGLGTAYGRSVYAPIRYVGFQRASASPSALLRIYYNDPQGALAMARHAGTRCCGPVSARHRQGVVLSLVDPARGHALSGVMAAGRTVVMGRHGHHYHIVLRNLTNQRKEAVVSVDGLDVVDGRRATYSKRGYILRPYGTLRIKGFRRSHARVAAFRFSTVRGSYAARTGQGGHVGVIGVALFDEHRSRWTQEQLRRRLGASPFANPPSYMVR